MKYVCVLRSEIVPGQTYVGKTRDHRRRIGLMGCSCTRNHVNMLLAALQKIKQGG